MKKYIYIYMYRVEIERDLNLNMLTEINPQVPTHHLIIILWVRNN